MAQSTENSLNIQAPPNAIYKALTDPDAICIWQAPEGMTGKIHRFDLRVGGGYEMSLFYPEEETNISGKTSEKEDRFVSRFTELIPDRKIVQVIDFQSTDTAFQGEMIMETVLSEVDGSTRVTFLFRNIPIGIRPEDNQAGTISSLQKLAAYVEQSHAVH